MSQPTAVPLRMYGRVVDHEPIEWPWVEQRITDSLFYTLGYVSSGKWVSGTP